MVSFIQSYHQSHIVHHTEQISAPQFWGWAGPSDKQIAEYQSNKRLNKDNSSDSEKILLEFIQDTHKTKK